MSRLALSKPCELEDFSHPDLIGVIRDVYRYRLRAAPSFPQGHEDRDHWDVAMAVRALRDFGALRPDSSVLGLHEGPSDLRVHVAGQVGQVVATTTGSGTGLPFSDDVFDGAFWCRSAAPGRLRDAAGAAYELGRVLKPGGVLAISMDMRLAGPPGRTGWPGRLTFSPRHLRQFVVEASGLELLDGLSWELSEQTLATPRDIGLSTLDDGPERNGSAGPGDRYEPSPWGFPRLITVRDGHVSTSVHLTLVKPTGYPVVANDWARRAGSTGPAAE